jgi:hypothetical protein
MSLSDNMSYVIQNLVIMVILDKTEIYPKTEESEKDTSPFVFFLLSSSAVKDF